MYSRSLYLHSLPHRFFSPADVRSYYDSNTHAFVRHGQGGDLGAIHRAVWAPGATTREQAFRHVERLIASEIDALALERQADVIDLGCGIGASLTYLATQREIRGTGVTLSPVQARIGRERAATLHLADRVQIVEGDYNALPVDRESMDVAYAIESFVHGPSPSRFFAEAARVLRPGGRLIVCDDVLIGSGRGESERTVAQFKRGWHVNSLLHAAQWRDLAGAAGLAHLATIDLTPHLEVGRLRDRLIGLLVSVVRGMPGVPLRLSPLIGGAALQRAISNGWIAYHCATFRR
jgi:cyclopropane fatty-acyl-phospholipid synthase-like methyltransferase